MRTTVGKLRETIRSDLLKERIGDVGTVTVTLTDIIQDCLMPYKPRPHPASGNAIFWAPFQARFKFDPNARLAHLAEDFGLVPSDVLSLLKRLRKKFYTPDGSVELRITPQDKVMFAEFAAHAIIEQFRDMGIEAVVPVGSSSNFVGYIVTEVAEGLDVPNLGPELDGGLISKPIDDPDTFRHDPVLWQKFAPDTEEQRVALKALLLVQDKKNVDMLARGEIPRSIHFKSSLRRFYDIQDIDEVMDSALVKSVLVIDDNIKEGTTFSNIYRVLSGRGIEVYFAAGYKLQKSKRDPRKRSLSNAAE